jgi:hypothetical protein
MEGVKKFPELLFKRVYYFHLVRVSPESERHHCLPIQNLLLKAISLI